MGLKNRPGYSISHTEDLFLCFFSAIDATAMLITLVAFGLKSAYGVHSQLWLLSNLSHWTKIYFITSTVQQNFFPKLEIFSTPFSFSFLGSATTFS